MTAEDRLIKYYQDAYEKLLKKLTELPPGASWEIYYKRLLKEIEKTVAELNGTAAKELTEIVKKAYTAAEAKVLQTIPGGPFGGLNREAMWLVAENAVDKLAEANQYFGRHIEDNIRQIGLDAIAEKLSTAMTVKEAKRLILNMLQEEGLTAMEDSSGRKLRLDSYAELVARTTTREATNTATTETGQQLGYDLVKFSTHYPTCAVCAPIQGRIFSISGKDKRFPALSEVPGFAEGFKTIHPNCRHVLFVTVEALWMDEERAQYLADAKKPVRGDTRLQEEIDRYNAMQAEKRDRWQDRRQYEKYRNLLGDDAPKTFSSFRITKGADNTKWEQIQLDYKRRARLLKNPDLALPNSDQCFAEDGKFLGYLYNPDNKDGYTKGLAFESHLGYNADNWKLFREEILKHANFNPVRYDRTTEFGDYYEQQMILYGLKGNPMDALVVWEVRDGIPRLVTIYPH